MLAIAIGLNDFKLRFALFSGKSQGNPVVRSVTITIIGSINNAK